MQRTLLSAENVTVSFGTRRIFRIEKLEIREGDRIGLVGMNGSGKTTLLELFSGKLAPDGGTLTLNCEPGYFRQLAGNGESWASAEEKSLFGVRELEGSPSVSGGEGTRLRLAELFCGESALFLIDEPTSHLDEEGVKYLSQRLWSIETFVLVSHDRDLLDAQCDSIIEIEDGEVRRYEGNYSSYLEQKKRAFERARFEYERYSDEMDRLAAAYRAKKEQAGNIAKKPRGMSSSEAKVRDFSSMRRSPKGKAKGLERSAENIKKRMEHMEVREKPKELPKIRPLFSLTDPPRNPIIMEAENLSFAYPNGREIFGNAVFRLKRGTRTVLLGGNGSGKTTLIRLILEGELIRIVPKAKLGYLRQDLSDLDDSLSVLECANETSVQPKTVVRNVLARLLFSASDIEKPVAVLSGGERVRLAFARIFVSSANVLVLDEPTNYLDIPSVEAIQALLSEYEGTLLFASHDRAFVRAVATDALLIENKKIVEYDLNDF
ncbi:MAG: ABC-F family ATP-binding cassette domain-containing protein [Clostridia bacterium]|nr:ABC-F family ATP-binding cassette domain-containing protein [Clostridia bacterium]